MRSNRLFIAAEYVSSTYGHPSRLGDWNGTNEEDLNVTSLAGTAPPVSWS
jgi:hypothetical protein